jgi:hypothetical protein
LEYGQCDSSQDDYYWWSCTPDNTRNRAEQHIHSTNGKKNVNDDQDKQVLIGQSVRKKSNGKLPVKNESWLAARLRLDRSTARYIDRENKI